MPFAPRRDQVVAQSYIQRKLRCQPVVVLNVEARLKTLETEELRDIYFRADRVAI